MARGQSMVASVARSPPGRRHYSDSVAKARAFDAIDYGGGGSKRVVNALTDLTALQTRVSWFCPCL